MKKDRSGRCVTEVEEMEERLRQWSMMTRVEKEVEQKLKAWTRGDKGGRGMARVEQRLYNGSEKKEEEMGG